MTAAIVAATAASFAVFETFILRQQDGRLGGIYWISDISPKSLVNL